MEETKCNKCNQDLKIGIQVFTTNIAYLVVNKKREYQNDQRPLLVCNNKMCERFGVVVVNPTFDIEPNY